MRFEMTFPEFVAIRLNQVPESTMDHKAASSFTTAIRRHEDYPLEDQLRIWIAAMIDKDLSLASRKRYVEKLSTIYKDFGDPCPAPVNPFEAVRELRDCEVTDSGKEMQIQCANLSRIFHTMVQDAKLHPGLALFLYLLFNASSAVEKAVSLTTEEYIPVFPQLDEIINPDSFHHRRRYVFDLSQSRKRMPQLTREVISDINSYLSAKGIKFSEPFTPATILSLWTAKAREMGVALSDIKATLDSIPPAYEYLNYVKGSELSKAGKIHIKKTIAEAFSPTLNRWFAMKLRRGSSFEELKEILAAAIPDSFPDIMFFYPVKVSAKRVGKKIVKETVPYIPDIVFLNTKQKDIRAIDRIVRHENTGWIFRQTNSPASEYSTIDGASMRAFQKAVGDFTPDMKIELTRESPVEIGREVRITGGVLAGYTGTIRDIRGGSDESRLFYIKLSEKYGIRVELKIEDFLVEPL